MFGLMKHLRLVRIRKQALYIARYGGWQTDRGGYTYDDDRIRIAISTDMTIIYCQNEHGDLKMVYSYEPKKRENIYHEGEWEKIIAARYQALKNTAR